MPVPIQYRKSGEGAVASYNYTDISEGTGIVAYYGMNTSGAVINQGYILTQQGSAYSNDIFTSRAARTGASGEHWIDLDFDVGFNAPKRIKGNAFLTATLGCRARNAGTTNIQYIAVLKRVSAGTAYNIAEGRSEIIHITDAAGEKTLSVKIPINTIQNFKKGDTLRLSMEVSGAQGGGASDITIWHDPIGRSGPVSTDNTSKLILYAPFVLDL